MSLTRPIPKAVREKLSADPFYKVCCIADEHCSEGKVEWHHNLTFAGKRVDDDFGILPACHLHHLRASVRDIHERFDYVMLSRAFDAINAKYERGGWRQRWSYLKEKFN